MIEYLRNSNEMVMPLRNDNELFILKQIKLEADFFQVNKNISISQYRFLVSGYNFHMPVSNSDLNLIYILLCNSNNHWYVRGDARQKQAKVG